VPEKRLSRMAAPEACFSTITRNSKEVIAMPDDREEVYAKEDYRDPLYLTDTMERVNPNFALRMDTNDGVFEGCHQVVKASFLTAHPNRMYDNLAMREQEERDDGIDME